ncbi:uncharacterized protein LOC120462416 [Tachysurus ichikawai]
MASQEALGGDESVPNPDFSSVPFSMPREPLRELINTFSDLYIDSEGENKDVIGGNLLPGDQVLPPPPPPDNVEENALNTSTDVSAVLERLTERFAALEERLTSISQRVSEQVTITDFESQRKATEDKLYRIDRECNRVGKYVQLLNQDLGQSVLDCLKRRDHQLEQRLQSLRPSTSTPVQPTNTYTVRASLKDQTYSLPSNTLPVMDNSSVNPYVPPVKLEFPSFSNSSEEDRSLPEMEEADVRERNRTGYLAQL